MGTRWVTDSFLAEQSELRPHATVGLLLDLGSMMTALALHHRLDQQHPVLTDLTGRPVNCDLKDGWPLCSFSLSGRTGFCLWPCAGAAIYGPGPLPPTIGDITLHLLRPTSRTSCSTSPPPTCGLRCPTPPRRSTKTVGAATTRARRSSSSSSTFGSSRSSSGSLGSDSQGSASWACHASILASASRELKAAVVPAMRQGRLPLGRAPVAAVDAMLRLLYGGRVKLSVEECGPLHNLAKKWGLKAICVAMAATVAGVIRDDPTAAMRHYKAAAASPALRDMVVDGLARLFEVDAHIIALHFYHCELEGDDLLKIVEHLGTRLQEHHALMWQVLPLEVQLGELASL